MAHHHPMNEWLGKRSNCRFDLSCTSHAVPTGSRQFSDLPQQQQFRLLLTTRHRHEQRHHRAVACPLPETTTLHFYHHYIMDEASPSRLHLLPIGEQRNDQLIELYTSSIGYIEALLFVAGVLGPDTTTHRWNSLSSPSKTPKQELYNDQAFPSAWPPTLSSAMCLGKSSSPFLHFALAPAYKCVTKPFPHCVGCHFCSVVRNEIECPSFLRGATALLLIPSLAFSSLFYRFLLSNIKATATTISPRPHPTTTAALSYFKVPSPFL